jgi:hypothetical protein
LFFKNYHVFLFHSADGGDNDDDDEDDEDEEESKDSPIKSASYMDELRQRLERVLNDSPQQFSRPIQSSLRLKEPSRRPTLIPPPLKLKPTNSPYLNSTENLNNQIKPPITVGSTPLPRKQLKSYGNLSYRTMNTTNHHEQQQQQPMSKSFIIPTKREGILFNENIVKQYFFLLI